MVAKKWFCDLKYNQLVFFKIPRIIIFGSSDYNLYFHFVILP